tara:strand:- start:1715 stop:2917 length:1203 start_codon:yes stop_codon:yes gene_type:complete
MAETTLALQIQNLVGGATLDQDFCDDMATEACKDIINQLPEELKEKCATRSTLNNSATTLDLDGKGDILHIVRLSADSGGYQIPCRKIPSMYGDLSNDPNDLNYYATASDPVYWTAANSSGNPTLFVKPLPTANQPAYVHHVTYPTVNVDASSTVEIANFPDEATHLVVLYAASRQLLKFQAIMTASWNSDITTALGAITTELNKADDIINTAHGKVGNYYTDIAELENADLWDDTNKRFDEVKLSLENAMSLIGFTTTGDKYNANYDLEANMADIDAELASATTQIAAEDTELGSAYIQSGSARMQQAQTQMNAVSTHLSTAQTAMSEINGLIQKHSLPLAGVPQYMSTASGYISQASGYVAEAGARLQQDVTKYQWYGDQYTKLFSEYTRGLGVLKGA